MLDLLHPEPAAADVTSAADLVVLVPMLGRPHRVAPLLESLDATVPGARVLFLLSPHDREVRAAVEGAGRQSLLVPYRQYGDYASKINTGYRFAAEPLIFTGADDLLFHPGWFEAAVARLTPGIGVVGTNDLANPRTTSGEHSTHSLVTREYADKYGTIDGPGAILCELYWHEFIDDELIGTARHRGAFAMALDSHVEHLHPHHNRRVPMDGLYAQQRIRMKHSRPLFDQRRRLWT